MNLTIKASEYCHSVFDGTHATPKPCDKGYKLVTSKHISNNVLDYESAYFISESDYLEINKRSKVSQWDILFSMIGTVGDLYLEYNENIDYVIKNIGVFSCKNELKAKWLFYYLKSPLAQNHIKRFLNGAVQKFLSLKQLRDFPVLSFDENKIFIVKILSALDQKIAINNQINAQLEQMAKTLYDYWFVQFDFPDENGKPYQSSGGEMVYNDTLKRNIPKGWEVGKLKDVLDNYSNSIKSDNLNKQSFYTPIDCLPIRKMSFWQTQPIDNAKTSLITYETNDILIGAMRVYFHRVCIAPFSGVTRSTTMVLRPKIKTNLPYLYQLCNEDKTIEYASSVSVGTQQPYVNWENGLAEFNIILPNLFLIQKYSKKVECLIKQIILNEKQNQQLTQLRDFLLPMLMNGQVMVQDV